MTIAAKIIYLTALTMGLAAGAFLGFRNAHEVLGALEEAKVSTAPLTLGKYGAAEYRYADSAHAQTALKMCADLLEKMQKRAPEKTGMAELVVVYRRLALLADASNDAAESQAYLAKARYWLKASGERDFTDEEMKEGQRALDKRTTEF